MAVGPDVRRAGAALALVALLATAAGCDWAQPRYDAGHTGHNSGEQALTVATVDGLEKAWSAAGPDGGNLVVARGTVVARDGEVLRAYDARTGAPRWSVDTVPEEPPGGEWPYGPPTVTDPTVVGTTVSVGVQVIGLSISTGNSIRSFDLATGAPRAGSPQGSRTAATQSPLTAAGGRLWGAFWAHSGSFEPNFYGVSGTSPVGGPTVVAGEASEFGDPPRDHTAVAVGDGIAAYGSPGFLRGIDAAGAQGCSPLPPDEVFCTPLWSLPVGDVVDTPVVRDGVVYATTASSLLALELRAPLGTAPGPLWAAAVTGGTAPAVTGSGDAYVGTSVGGGRLEVYEGMSCPNGANCAPTWVGPVGGPVTASPTVAGNVVYVPSGTRVSAFSAGGCGAATCSPLWTADVPGKVTSPVVVIGGRVYVSADDALVVYALPG
jgi:hypothetical protein